MTLNDIITKALGTSKEHFHAFIFFKECKEAVLNAGSKQGVAIGAIAVHSIVKEKFPNLQYEQIEELLATTFGGNDKQLIKFIIENDIKLKCECENCKDKKPDAKDEPKVEEEEVRVNLPKELIEMLEKATGAKIHIIGV